MNRARIGRGSCVFRVWFVIVSKILWGSQGAKPPVRDRSTDLDKAGVLTAADIATDRFITRR